MKILMSVDTVGGVWTYALELARALAPHGVECALAAMGRLPSRDQQAEAAIIPGLTLHAGEYRLEWMDAPWEDVRRAGEWLLDLEALLRPDVVHLNGYAHGALPWRSPVLVVGHSCVLSWWEAVKGEPAPESWNRYRREVASGLEAADLLAAPTREMLRSLVRHYDTTTPGKVVPNGRRAERFRPAPKEAFVFSAGRLWDEAKNLALLDRVAPRLSWPVLVAGEQQCPDGRIIESRSVRLLGQLSQVRLAEWLGKASIYALPARYEPFGLSILEAALCGCALVVGDIPSLREVWDDAALYVAPDDPESLATTLQTLIDDPGRTAALGHRARERAFEFTPERMAAAYLGIYQDLATRRRDLRAGMGLESVPEPDPGIAPGTGPETGKEAVGCAS